MSIKHKPDRRPKPISFPIKQCVGFSKNQFAELAQVAEAYETTISNAIRMAVRAGLPRLDKAEDTTRTVHHG